ncbi:GNAT family N-acetyltransferase [Aliikangiella maris]|uniref:GNAT family N-acetyltransferase n=2 Tax=Aliikangiella maris TaxID=3162458 RepID=A0ABV3MQM2_9GAMM
MESQPIKFISALSDTQLDAAREIFKAYESSVNACQCFQNFTHELNNLADYYHFPMGEIWLAISQEQSNHDLSSSPKLPSVLPKNEYQEKLFNTSLVAGCIALKPVGNEAGEIKRLFVKPSFRGMSIGQRLLKKLVLSAQSKGMKQLVLETVPQFASAIKIYQSFGFELQEPDRKYQLNEIMHWKLTIG